MDKSFWHQRWEKNEIGFHRKEPNRFLVKYGTKLIKPEHRVLIPLCGKTLDLLWIADKANSVTGVEISGKAIESFFIENGLDFNKDTWFYSSKNITILEKDLFEISSEEAGHPDFVYDRASIVALPEDIRRKYADKIIALAPAQILIVTTEYNQSEMNGPPFSVSEDEIRSLYSHAYKIDCLESVSDPGFRERGLTSLNEKCFLLEKR